MHAPGRVQSREVLAGCHAELPRPNKYAASFLGLHGKVPAWIVHRIRRGDKHRWHVRHRAGDRPRLIQKIRQGRGGCEQPIRLGQDDFQPLEVRWACQTVCDLAGSRFLESNDRRAPCLLQSPQRAQPCAQVTPQQQEHRPSCGECPISPRVKRTIRAGCKSVEIDGRVRRAGSLRHPGATGKMLLGIAAARVEDGEVERHQATGVETRRVHQQNNPPMVASPSKPASDHLTGLDAALITGTVVTG